MSFKKWLAIAAAILLPISAYAEINSKSNPTLPFLNITGPNQLDGVSINPNTAAAGNFTTLNATGATTLQGNTTFTSAATFSSASTFNNTVTFNSAETNNGSITFNSGATLNSGITSIDTHYQTFGNSLLTNPIVQSTFQSFTTASANAGINILNSTAGRKIFPGPGLAIMVSGTAAGATSVILQCQPSHRAFVTWPIAQLVTNVPVGIYASSATVLGSALVNGCDAADSIFLSVNGTLSTTSQLFVNLPYTVQ